MRVGSIAAALVATLLLAAGCQNPSSDDSAEPADEGDPAPDPDPGTSGGAAECEVADDCAAAGESCCVCPTFAVPISSGWQDSCEDVSCDPPEGCSAVAACNGGSCALRCLEVACAPDSSCPGGFARDAAGCLGCECAPTSDPSAEECAVDDDCVQVAADCCGCARGGSDTAVPADQAGDFADGLGCDGSATCPGVNVCDLQAAPRCIAGSCQLASDGGGDSPGGGGGESAQLCGTPELAPCAPGQQCVVNDPDSGRASEMGVGVCRP